MIDVYHRIYRLEFDVWDPHKKATDEQLAAMLVQLKTRKLLPDAGNVKIVPVTEERIGVLKESTQ